MDVASRISSKRWIWKLSARAITGAVIFHSLNGLRIIIQDFWPVVMVRQRQLVWVAAVITVLAIIPIGWVMLAPVFGLAEEPGTARHIVRCQEHPTAVACIQEGSAESEEVGL